MGKNAGPLERMRVLDIGQGIAAPFCAKLLGDLGADVVKIEPPEGDLSRQIGPFPKGTPDAELSASFFFLNTSKRSVVADLTRDDGRLMLSKLVPHFDIVISSDTIEALDAQNLGYDDLKKWNPKVILTTVTGFGSFGPHSHYESSHLVNCAVGGWAQLCGLPDREPLQSGGAMTDTLGGAFAAVATSLAFYGRERHGGGEHVDVSVQEAVLAGAQMPTLLYEYSGNIPERYSSVGSGAGAAYILPTSEGYIGLNALTLPQWHMLCAFLGREDIPEDPKYRGISWAKPDQRLEEIRSAFQQALEGRTAEQLFHEAEKARVPFGLVPDLKGLFGLKPHVERSFFLPLDHPEAGTVAVPSIPFNSNASLVAKPYRPPLLGEHTEEILQEIKSLSNVPMDNAEALNPLPLKGLRVLDLSMFFAGPVCAQILADAGAEVIKVESVQRIDGWRGAGTTGEGDVPTWEGSPYFNWVNRNKRGITLNLKDSRGIDAIKTMVKDADVLIENYTPRVMDNFGLGYDVLKEINPDLIMISLSGFGSDTSWRDYVAFGMSTEQMSGACHLTGYEGEEPLFTGTTGGDLFSGVMGANALLAALHSVDANSGGQHINFSQVEACNLYLGDVMTGWSLAETDPGRSGNRHAVYAPQGMYPCQDDRWIAITCKTDKQWRVLASLIGSELQDASFEKCEARQKAREQLDKGIADWTKSQNALDLMEQLQNKGIPAGAVLKGPDLLADPQLKARNSFIEQDRPGVGPKHYPNQPYRFANTEAPPVERAPLLGEHSMEVLTSVANMTDEDIVELVIDDVVGTVPMAAR